MPISGLTLKRPLRATSESDPDDVLSAKSAFNELGYYDVPQYGLTPYPDQALFDGIRSYQRDEGLDADGYMLPEGETEQSINKSLSRTKNPDAEGEGCVEQAASWWPPISGLFPRRNFCPVPREKADEPDCEGQALDDESICRSIGGPQGPYRRQRCWASVQARYGHCRAKGELGRPPLDTGEW